MIINLKIMIILALSFSSFGSSKLDMRTRKDLSLSFERRSAKIVARAGSGDVVGNGSGIAEQNTFFALERAPYVIENCLINDHCKLSKSEKIISKDILTLLNQFNIGDIYFIGQQDRAFFNDSNDSTQRVAKTGFTPESNILFNLAYLIENKLENDISFLFGVLVHELGHKAGHPSHNELSALSQKLRLTFDFKIEKNVLKVNSVTEIESTLFNYNESQGSSYLYFAAPNNAINATSKIFSQAKCENNNYLNGFKIDNAHWSTVRGSASNVVNFKAWIDLSCEDSFGVISIVEKELSITIEVKHDSRITLKSIAIN